MSDRIPDQIMRGRSSLGKQLTKDRFYQRAKKKVIYTYIWFLIGGAFGAHRFYLGRWKSALAIFAIFWTLFLMPSFQDTTFIASGLLLILLAAELILVPFLTKWTNEKIKQDFDLEIF